MSFVLQTLIVLSFGFFVYYLWSRRRFYKAWYQMPGPLGLPLIGIGLNVLNPIKFLKYFAETSKYYKSPFFTWLGPKCCLYVNDPVTMEFILNSPHCINKGDFYKFISSAGGDGLFTSSSPRWNKHRRLINPAFSRSVLNNFLPIFNAEADVFVEKLRAASRPIDISELIRISVLEVACHTTLGKKMNFSSSDEFYQSFTSLTEVLIRRILAPWLYPDFIYQHSNLYKLQETIMKVIYGVLDNLIKPENTNKNESNFDSVNGDEETGISNSKAIFVEQMRKYAEQGELTWKDVRDEAVVVVGTFDTVSTALYFICLCLALHPESQEKLYEELVEIFPDENNMESFEITQEHLGRMIYVEKVINEAMRLFAPIPMVARNVSNDLTLPNGAAIPKGTQVLLDIFNMHRNEEVWGLKAKEFNPDLHFGASEQQSIHPFAFVPFTKGLRMCIGTRYASMIMKVFVAKVFRNFIIRTDAKLNDLVIKATLSVKLAKYPLCEIVKRDK